MSYEFKKLGEVEALTEIPENANALVEVGGAIKRVPAGVLANVPVVILPETEATQTDDGFMIMTPLSATPTDGATAEINYNGVKYTSPIIYDEQNAMFAMGNTETVGIQGGNADAPFFVGLASEGKEGMYGMVIPLDGATSVALSIVEAAKTESTGGGVLMINVSFVMEDINSFSNPTKDKSYAEIKAAYDAGAMLYCKANLLSSSGDVCGVYVCPLFSRTLVSHGQLFNGFCFGGIYGLLNGNVWDITDDDTISAPYAD